MAEIWNAILLKETMDPHEELEYVLEYASLLEDGEEIVSAEVTVLEPELGLVVTDYNLIETNQNVEVWLAITEEEQNHARWNSPGLLLSLRCKVTTNNSPARKRDRTWQIRVTTK